MKKIVALILALSMCTAMISGCTQKQPASSDNSSKTESSQSESKQAGPVTLKVVTEYGGDDGNRKNYEDSYKAWETKTGNKVDDNSGTAVEEWKAKVLTDFQTGAEPDVLFFFNGIDSNPLIEGKKVVSIDEIREKYPDYAANMKDDMMGASLVDGKNYSVPVNGYWEGLYCNTKILKDNGLEVPGATTTWDDFMKTCEALKAKGITPIACSVQEVPHYWFEYCVFNYTGLKNHLSLPKASSDATGKAWASGLNDLKDIFTKGYFPKNTNTAKDEETFQLMADGKAVFAIDGSWKLGWFQDKCKNNLADYTVTYVPAKGERKATDLIGGLSSGYYITRKAWEDPAKQQACVDFIKFMTTDEVVTKFGETAITALKNGTVPPANPDNMVTAALELTKNATGVVGAAQDGLSQNARGALFADVKNIATGKTTAEKSIEAAIAIK